MKIAPDKVYVHRTIHLGLLSASDIDITGQDDQYIRKDIVDEMLKTAEDHAYFAGQENLREKLLEWAKNMKRICKGAEPIEKAYQTMIDKISSL